MTTTTTKMLPVPMRVAVFGATSSIAAEVAKIYARRGAQLFLVGRDPGKLAALVEVLGAAVVGSLVADLNELAFAPEWIAQAARAFVRVSGVHNNNVRVDAPASSAGIDVALIAHGWLGDQLATERDYADADAVLKTNFLSAVALLVPLANRFEAQGGGHIAVLSSVAGARGRPRNYTYGAAKGALTVYLQGLRTRLYARGVGVHTILLGPVDTPMTAHHRKHALFGRPERVAIDIVAAIDKGRGEVYVPWFWRYIMAAVRATPEPIIQRVTFLSGR